MIARSVPMPAPAKSNPGGGRWIKRDARELHDAGSWKPPPIALLRHIARASHYV